MRFYEDALALLDSFSIYTLDYRKGDDREMKEISAGGLVYKKVNNDINILIIEDRFQKISIPKGKQEEGETLEETAIREIEEETGIQGIIKDKLETVSYQYLHKERGEIDKEVTYYLVEAIGGEIETQIEEINKVYWLDVEQAKILQLEKGYDNNHIVFEKGFLLLGKVL